MDWAEGSAEPMKICLFIAYIINMLIIKTYKNITILQSFKSFRFFNNLSDNNIASLDQDKIRSLDSKLSILTIVYSPQYFPNEISQIILLQIYRGYSNVWSEYDFYFIE